MPLTTIKRRPDFLAVRGGARFAGKAFVMEAKARVVARAVNDPGPRFGFTVTKKLGNAVMRNRVKRRLREAVRTISPQDLRSDFDYVVIARDAALTLAFLDLKFEIARAIAAVSKPSAKATAKNRSARPKPDLVP